mmetsp:Transcript_32870/g.72472  ORF Transcript_32870/g.72472 Transcript_32870/m.72472 type:complete len:507 (-) Transcript_32870:300-1820(-)
MSSCPDKHETDSTKNNDGNTSKSTSSQAPVVVVVDESASSCPICLADMEPADLSHPMLCPTQCGYNFCADCAQQLIESSQDDYQEASDGNRHVKVRLQCPQCRGDLSTTIAETLLLRKHATMRSRGYQSTPDTELSAAELRLKHEGVATKAQLALAKKVYREAAADIGVDLPGASSGVGSPRHVVTAVIDSIDDETGEEALEVDEHEEAVVALPIDVTLFNGLEFAMTEDEQRYVTEKMVSGEPAQLAQAAQILSGISELMMKGITPSMRSQKAKAKTEALSAASACYNRASASSNGRGQKSAWAGSGASNAGAVGRALAMAQSDADRKKHLREAEIAAHRRMHPLPTRMPRHVTLDAFDPNMKPVRRCPLLFADDEWDGSIADAFARVHIGRGGKVNKGKIDKAKEDGVHNVLMAGGGSTHETHISSPSNRVVVAASAGQAGRMGIQKGDVVTHVNGEEFTGSADSLRAQIDQIWGQEGEGGSFSLVVNAEPCTAEALRLRALVL